MITAKIEKIQNKIHYLNYIINVKGPPFQMMIIFNTLFRITTSKLLKF